MWPHFPAHEFLVCELSSSSVNCQVLFVLLLWWVPQHLMVHPALILSNPGFSEVVLLAIMAPTGMSLDFSKNGHGFYLTHIKGFSMAVTTATATGRSELISSLVCGFIPPAGFPSPIFIHQSSLYQTFLHFFLFSFCDSLARVRRGFWVWLHHLWMLFGGGAYHLTWKLPRCPQDQNGWRALI